MVSLFVGHPLFAAEQQSVAATPLLAFPEAQGYGKFTQGGRGGRIIVVDSLQDNEQASPGTLRYAVKASGPRIVVFAVSGVSNLVKPLEIKHDFITIAGQTSPGGIVISGSETQIDASQVIIRYLRFRPGAKHQQGDAITAKRQHHIIIDHCSMSWANDEVASFYNNTDFTLQHSIISESLNNAGHAKGSHGYGGIWGGKRASFINNVMAHHVSRNPRINGYRLKPNYQPDAELVDIRNNVIYNWGHTSAYGNEGGRVNFMSNWYKPGPDSEDAIFFLIEHPDNMGTAYFSGNVMEGKADMTADNRLGIHFKNQKKMSADTIYELQSRFLSAHPLTDKNISIDYRQLTAAQSFRQLITAKEVGANRNRHGVYLDSVDRRILSQIAQGKVSDKSGIIDSELQSIASWQAYQEEFQTPQPSPAAVQAELHNVQDWIDKLGQFSL